MSRRSERQRKADEVAATVYDTSAAVVDLERGLDRLGNDFESLITTLSAPVAPTSWIESIKAQKVLFHLTDGTTIAGIVLSELPDGVRLHTPVLIEETGDPVAMSGEVIIPRDRVKFVQTEG